MKYQILGETLPVVICELEEGEQMLTEAGAMSWMSPNMEMETTTNGGIGKALGRALTGEKMFQNIYTAKGGPGMIAYASSVPGSIRAFEITPNNEMIFQKGAFLAGGRDVTMQVHFKKKIGVGLFGGEGFLMQKIGGNGTVFAEFDGHVVEYDLKAGERIIVDTGHVAAMSATCSIDIQTVAGAKNKFFGGEGFFNTVITGPGHLWLQTMPLANLAGAIRSYIPTQS